MTTPTDKPFKGVIRDWYRDGDVIEGICEYHVNAAPMSPQSLLHNHLVVGYRMHTSEVYKIEDRGAFSLLETKNSFYILTTPFCDREMKP